MLQVAPPITNFNLKASVRSVPIEGTGPPQFIQCWAVGRGYSGVTQALDSAGQVWERVSLMGEIEVEGKKVKVVKDSYWLPLSMQRRALEEKEEA